MKPGWFKKISIFVIATLAAWSMVNIGLLIFFRSFPRANRNISLEKIDLTDTVTLHFDEYHFSLRHPKNWRVHHSGNGINFLRPSSDPLRMLAPVLLPKIRPPEWEIAFTIKFIKDDPKELTYTWLRRQFPDAKYSHEHSVGADVSKVVTIEPVFLGNLTWSRITYPTVDVPKLYIPTSKLGAIDLGDIRILAVPFYPEILSTFQYDDPVKLGGPDFKPWVNEHPMDTSGWREFTSRAVGIKIKYPLDWEVKESAPNSDRPGLFLEYNITDREKIQKYTESLMVNIDIHQSEAYLNQYLHDSENLLYEAIKDGKESAKQDTGSLKIAKIIFREFPGYVISGYFDTRYDLYLQKNRNIVRIKSSRHGEEISESLITNILHTIEFTE